MMGASYLDDLAAQVAEKRRAQESEKLRDRAANLQHMGAAPFTGGPIAGGPAHGFLAEQGARVERAQAELGDAPRPRGGAQQHGVLQAAQPLDPGRMNGLFGAPRAPPAALQAGPAAPPMPPLSSSPGAAPVPVPAWFIFISQHHQHY